MRFKTFLLSILEFLINPFSVLLSYDLSTNDNNAKQGSKSTKRRHPVLMVIIWTLLSIVIALCLVYLAHLYIEVK